MFSLPLRQLLGHTLALIALLPGLLLPAVALAETRIWTSSIGTTVEADYVAQVADQHWLRKEDGGLLKLRAPDLSPTDQDFIRASRSKHDDGPHVAGNVIVLETPTGRDVETLETLLGTILPAFEVKEDTLEATLEKLTATIKQAAPERGQIEFRVHADCKNPPRGIVLRNFSAWRTLQIITGNMAATVLFRGDHVEILPISLAKAKAKPVFTKQPPPCPVPTVVGSAPPDAPARCSLRIETRNYIQHGDLEQDSKRWVIPNQEKQFKRVNSSLVISYSDAPQLGKKVMRLEPIEATSHQGPPYITQTVSFSTKPMKIRLCIEVLHVGVLEKPALIRLSATDPDLRYTHDSNLKFPYDYGIVRESERWHHVEAVLDISTIRNREVVIGFMFPSAAGEWYFDNLCVAAE